jgi:hypothetical protein
MKFIKWHLKNLNNFDEITKFRLICLAIIMIMLNLYIPVLVEFKYLLNLTIGQKIIAASTIIALINFLQILVEKFIPKIIIKTKFSLIYKSYVIIIFLFGLSSLLYFYNKKIFIFVDSILGILINLVTILYSQVLTNYMSYFYSKDFTKFQNYRTHLIVESSMLGLIISIILSFYSNNLNVILFFIGMMIYSLFLFKNWNIMNKYDFSYLLNLKRSLK